MANKANESRQTITLPQGGGALHGIGESFSPDLHTGTGNFKVPISVPAGRNGLQPELNLAYSSGSGNSHFGLGWNVSVPNISRKTSRGIPRYENERDVFLLSGGEDLVPVDFADGVTRYRPRTEGMFARIEHHVGDATNHWEVRSKSGLASFFGPATLSGSEAATLTNPEDSSQIFCWPLTETSDAYGNKILYNYDSDAGDDQQHIWSELYLKQIRYVDYVDPQSNDVRFLVSVTFIYDERPDPYSDFRPGFETRTTKRCTRIEVRTHADRERLVRSYELIYLDQRSMPDQLPLNGVSLLSQIVVVGHDEEAQAPLPTSEAMPPLEFGYSVFAPGQQHYQSLSGSRPPRSLADPDYELVDLQGNGLPSVVELNQGAHYWRNRGYGQFDEMRSMELAPADIRLSQPSVQLLDANGNGRADLMVVDAARTGFFPLSFHGQWSEQSYVHYPIAPPINFDAADVRLVDLDGDGITDALRTGAQFELFYNDRELGWASLETRQRTQSDSFPDVSFEDPRVRLADMTGDELQDIVLIHNGRIDYWPYRGYGRWGRRVTMQNCPLFEDAAAYPGTGFDPKRLLIGDIDGDGVADLAYVASDHVTAWINRGGNAWSEPITVYGTPPVANTAHVRLADMLGTGTEGILWTYDFGAFQDSNYKFLDLTGGRKPYVLEFMDNNLGAITKVSYSTSTRFFLDDDARAETRWKTPLPFPVQVVARVDVIDAISRSKLTTQYRYHHGYWDGREREFRGFAMVEQLDSESFADYRAASNDIESTFDAVTDQHFSPPTLTKNWFHVGPVDQETGDWEELDWSEAFWSGDPPALSHTESINAFLQGLTDRRHKRDALRSLRGSLLRTELYALDGSEREQRPYMVTELSYGLREEAPPEAASPYRQRIFFPHPLASRKTHWERGDEPMTRLSFTDDYDAYGQARRQVGVAVPRNRDFRVSATSAEPYLATLTETKFAQRDDASVYIADRVSSSASFEIQNDGSLSAIDLAREAQAGTSSREMLGQSFSYYDGASFEGLSLGELGSFGALVRRESLVLTDDLLDDLLDPATQLPPYL